MTVSAKSGKIHMSNSATTGTIDWNNAKVIPQQAKQDLIANRPTLKKMIKAYLKPYQASPEKIFPGFQHVASKRRAAKYEVIVGNVGTVFEGNNQAEAEEEYQDYVVMAKEAHGRPAGESVTLTREGEPWQEHPGREARRITIARPKYVPKGLTHIWAAAAKVAHQEGKLLKKRTANRRKGGINYHAVNREYTRLLKTYRKMAA